MVSQRTNVQKVKTSGIFLLPNFASVVGQESAQQAAKGPVWMPQALSHLYEIQKLKKNLNKIGSTGCKRSSLNAPGTDPPVRETSNKLFVLYHFFGHRTRICHTILWALRWPHKIVSAFSCAETVVLDGWNWLQLWDNWTFCQHDSDEAPVGSINLLVRWWSNGVHGWQAGWKSNRRRIW